MHEPLVALASSIINDGGSARRTWLEAMRAVYLDEPLEAQQRLAFDDIGYEWPEVRTPWPALRCGVDAVHSKIAKTHPRGLVETIDGDWGMQCRAEAQTAWLDGMMSELGVDEIGERCFQDCLIGGTGAVYVGQKHGRPMVERVKVRDLFVDPLEEANDCVRSLYRARPMDVDVLCEMVRSFAEGKKADDLCKKIRDAKRMEPSGDHVKQGETSDMILAFEAWRLADGPKSKGRHVIAIDGAALLDDKTWKGKRFPFAFVHWSRDPDRFWGIGLVEQMLQPQGELNDIARTNSDARHLLVPTLHVESDGQGHGLQVEQLANDMGRVYVRAPGTAPPTLLDPGPIHLAMAQLEELYIQRVWNLNGINRLDTQSEKPAGLNSGKAIQNFADVTSERFAVANRSWERFFVDICELLRDVADEICSGESEATKLEVMGGKDQLESISYADAKLGDHPSRIRVFPVSKLSDSISAKIDEVERMVNAQMISDMDEARELMDIPDLKRFNTIASAGRRLVRKIIDRALKLGEATSPNPYMPLPYLIRYGTLSADLAQEQNAPDDHVQCLRDIVQAAIEMKQGLDAEQQAKAAAAAPPPMPAGPPMPPTGGPMPAPPMGPPPMPGLAVVPPPGA